MTHLKIEQNTGAIEQVNSALISKLYQLLYENNVDVQSDVIGRVHSTGAYAHEVQWLMQNYQNLYITADKLYVKFQDPLAQQWCVTNFSSDGVGCSPEDLSSVTSIDITSFTNSGIVNFDEFKYFTGITNIDLAINTTGNSTLKSITLPSSARYIGGHGYGGGFFGYSALESINIPDNCNLGQAVFRNCTSLRSVTFGQNCTLGYGQVFQGCSSLESVDLGGIINLSEGMFENCSSLTSITIPNSVTKIQNGFVGSSGVNSITFEEGGTTPLVLQGGTNGWKPGVFRTVGSQKIVFPERLSELKDNALGCTAAMTYVFTSTTPPSVTGNGQITTDITNSKIYVPDSALADYKAATGFSTYASYIYPVSELPS